MNLCVDIGNTKIKAALFKGFLVEDLLVFKSQQELFEWIDTQKIDKAIFSSVGIYIDEKAIGKLQKKVPVIHFLHNTPVIIKNNYETPETLGLDRIAASVGGTMIFPNENTLVIDAGTCITYDYVDAENVYLGGSIHPGLYLRAKAMHHFTKRLPLVEIDENVDLLATSTQTCLQSGAYWGTVCEIENMIERYQSLGKLKVILTGGDAEILAKAVKKQIFVRPLLVLEGLNQILEFNA